MKIKITIRMDEWNAVDIFTESLFLVYPNIINRPPKTKEHYNLLISATTKLMYHNFDRRFYKFPWLVSEGRI
jgi:hypothetical protein